MLCPLLQDPHLGQCWTHGRCSKHATETLLGDEVITEAAFQGQKAQDRQKDLKEYLKCLPSHVGFPYSGYGGAGAG